MWTEAERDLRGTWDVRMKLSHTSLVIAYFVFATATRPLTYIGAPKVLDFIHFGLIALAIVVLLRRGVINKPTKPLLLLLLALISVFILSALLNSGSVLAALIGYMIIVEPLFWIYYVHECRRQIDFRSLRAAVLTLIIANAAFIYFQKFLLGFDGDAVQGIFLGAGAGAHLAGAVSLVGSLFILASGRIRASVVLLAGVVAAGPIFSDAKQVVGVALLALVVTLFLRARSVISALRLIALTACSVAVVTLMAFTVFPALRTWIDNGLILAAIEQKFAVVPLIRSAQDGVVGILFGMGPGTSVSRLALLIPEYSDSLSSFGIVSSPVTQLVYETQQSQYYTNSITGSSFFSLTFSWAGIWGDTGALGLVLVAALYAFIYSRICVNESGRFILVLTVLLGATFTWMEEPAYMALVAIVIGIQLLNRRQEYELVSCHHK